MGSYAEVNISSLRSTTRTISTTSYGIGAATWSLGGTMSLWCRTDKVLYTRLRLFIAVSCKQHNWFFPCLSMQSTNQSCGDVSSNSIKLLFQEKPLYMYNHFHYLNFAMIVLRGWLRQISPQEVHCKMFTELPKHCGARSPCPQCVNS